MKFTPEELSIILLENPNIYIAIYEYMRPRCDSQLTLIPEGFRLDFGYGKFEENKDYLYFKFKDYSVTWSFTKEDEARLVEKYNINLTEFNNETNAPSLRSWNGEWLDLVGKKLWNYEELDKKLKYPLDVLLKAIVDGHVEVENEKGEKILKVVFAKHNLLWIKHKGRECFLPWEDYKKTWWLMEDRSE